MAASDARSLASRIAQLDDPTLTDMLALRRVSASVAWSDAFDAADALLDPASVSRALIELSADDADALDAALESGGAIPDGVSRDRLSARALVDDEGRPYASVAAGRALVNRVAPRPASSNAPVAAASDDHAAELAFEASAALADILQATLILPVSRIGSGLLGAADRRRLVESGAAPDGRGADELIAIAERAGLLAVDDRHWLVTRAGIEWMSLGTVDRWESVARRLREALPSAVRTVEGGWMPVAEWPTAYPFDPTWPNRAAVLRGQLERWAVVAADGEPAGWARRFAAGGDADLGALQARLPPEVDRVYLQNDLTAIAPGPLAPQLDMRLRLMARRESRAQASTYRFTAETLSEAFTAGETADTVREFLTALSLTGLPQPLAYEIERSASRHGALRVGPDSTGQTLITSDDTSLLRTVAVDQALRPLGLTDLDEGLATRSSPDTAFWLLADARYPVVAVGPDGQRRTLDRHRLAPDVPAAPAPAGAAYAPLVARLRAAHAHDADAAWLGRELEQAARSRALLIVAVRLPDGSDREVTLEVTGLGGGRLRGRDRGADVERTLPISSIVSVRPV
ncbi:helicase-associated domain-containing protein [Microbacterium sp.]|uniref:helicase-associated domain-containing protein n=1 Tax=Microbacterium sp. TaxID=51671 RepID=UPI0025D7AAB7|nr:helicase-associated domain-containing protein [Microbacterium sp.]